MNEARVSTGDKCFQKSRELTMFQMKLMPMPHHDQQEYIYWFGVVWLWIKLLPFEMIRPNHNQNPSFGGRRRVPNLL